MKEKTGQASHITAENKNNFDGFALLQNSTFVDFVYFCKSIILR